jgi:hypothetical protein
MSLRKILTNFPVGLQARKRPALICRSRKRGVHRSNAAASCLVKIAAFRSSAACELADFETASADGFLALAIYKHVPNVARCFLSNGDGALRLSH